MFVVKSKYKEKEELDTLVEEQDTPRYELIVWNDDVNTFDWVIKCLIEICDHTQEQAEQCALFIHFKGKYGVKEGGLSELRPQCEALLDRGLSATISGKE